MPLSRYPPPVPPPPPRQAARPPPPPTRRVSLPQQPAIPRETIVKRRSAIYTVAVAIIVIAGVVAGAKWKTDVQTKDKVRKLQMQQGEGTEGSDTASAQAVPLAVATNKEGHIQIFRSGLQKSTAVAVPSSEELSKQIALLEERRGRLVGQKMGLEKKLEGVRVKMELERRRDAARDASAVQVER